VHADVEDENTQSIKELWFQAATLIVSRILFQKSYIFMKTSELEAVSGAKETYSAVCGIPAPKKLAGSLNVFSNSAFHHTNSLRSWRRMGLSAIHLSCGLSVEPRNLALSSITRDCVNWGTFMMI
jgi:hypothetical protein